MNLRALRTFRSSLGPLEQAWIVITTAVVVTLITIIAFRVIGGEKLGWYDQVSVVVAGIVGIIIIVSTISYGRQTEQQKQEILALKTIAEAVNRAVDIPYLLQNALQEVRRLLNVEYAWIYSIDDRRLSIDAEKGTEEIQEVVAKITELLEKEDPQHVRTPRIHKRTSVVRDMDSTWAYRPLGSWGSVPIMMKDQIFGLIVVGSEGRSSIRAGHIELMTAFANQIGIAIENATLFQKLRQSEERYMDLFENSPDMYHIVDRNGTIVSCNQTEADRLRYRKEELVGQSLLKLYPPDRHIEMRRLLRQIFEHGKEFTDLEEQFLTSEGAVVHVSVNTSILYDEAGKPAFARAVARDITEKKKLEARVVHAQRIDSIGNLAGGVAHDFNNILTSILGSTAIMKRKMRKNISMYRFVDIIDTAAKRGADLTRQLLTFARKTSVQYRPIIVNDIIAETMQLFERSVEKTISIQTHLTDEVCVMNGDDGQIQQALLNLLINARDAMPEGGKITVATERLARDPADEQNRRAGRSGEQVIIRVSDTGVGMDRQTQQRIFEPFFTTKEQGKGTGLGLAVVYGVVNAHGGTVSVDSLPGQGTEFSLTFPLLATAPPDKKAERRARPAKGAEHVLVVDDEEDVGNVILGMLKALGYKATFVTSGKKAVSAYKRGRRFSAVMLDLNMPEMTGRDTLLRLREIDPSIRVIISTGYSNKMAELSDIGSSIHGFLHKPYQIEELSEVLRPVLHNDRAPGA